MMTRDAAAKCRRAGAGRLVVWNLPTAQQLSPPRRSVQRPQIREYRGVSHPAAARRPANSSQPWTRWIAGSPGRSARAGAPKRSSRTHHDAAAPAAAGHHLRYTWQCAALRRMGRDASEARATTPGAHHAAHTTLASARSPCAPASVVWLEWHWHANSCLPLRTGAGVVLNEGRYRIDREINRGATAVVYAADDLQTSNKVGPPCPAALQMLPPNPPLGCPWGA